MTTQHTPGPWIVERSLGFSRFLIRDVMGEVCASVSAYSPRPEADANLVSAAPDMLDALREFIGAVDSGTTFADASVVEAARAAIAKATGNA